MRELEFLPSWYGQTLARRRLVVLQAWMTFALAVGVVMWVVFALIHVRKARAAYEQTQGMLVQSHGEMRQIDKLNAQLAEFHRQQRILGALGAQVESTRILRALDSAMPREMSLVGLQMDVEELADERPAVGKGAAALSHRRRLRVRMQGIAPTDADMTNFVAQLGGLPFLENVAITHAKEKGESGRVLREFEVTFSVNLGSVGTVKGRAGE